MGGINANILGYTYHLDCIFVGLSVWFDVARVRELDPDEQYPHEYREDPKCEVNVVVLLQRHRKDLNETATHYHRWTDLFFAHAQGEPGSRLQCKRVGI